MWLTLILIVVTSLLTLIYFWLLKNFNYWTRHPTVPSTRGKIFSGNFKDFITFKTNFGFHLRTIYEDEKFQNEAVVGIYGLYKPALLIREPKLLKSIFIKDFDLFRNRACQGGKHDLLGFLNLFFAKYSYWKETRSKLVPVFSSGKLKNMYPLIEKVGESLDDYLNKQPNCFVAEMKDLSGRYTIDVISTTILGTVSSAVKDAKHFMFIEALKLVEFSLKRSLELLIIFFAPKLNPLVRPKSIHKSTEKFLRSSIKEIMTEREKLGTKRNDLIDAFVKIKKEAEIKGDDLSYCMEGIIAQAGILMIAAFDASSSAVSLALLELAKHAQVQQTLREEILQALLKENGEISYETLNKLEYLQMVLEETLRLYPVLPIFERLHEFRPHKSKGFNLKPYYDFVLPNEMPVYISVLAIHHDAKYWPNPEKFDPARFSPTNKKLHIPMTYMPFGEGPHMCIGSRLGLLQAKVALVHFLKNHYVRVCAQTIAEPKFEPKAIMLQTKGGIHVEFVRDNLYLDEINKQDTQECK